jgi:hypothetical protein
VVAYEGKREKEGCKVVRRDGEEWEALSLRLDLWNHSPTGFGWGYAGSGPAQLSLALLADALGDEERVISLHQDVKQATISRLIDEDWQMTEEEIRDEAQKLQAQSD